MKFKIILLFIATGLFFSCKEKEEGMSPIQLELGKYQMEIKGNTYDMINTIELKIEGNVIGSGIIQYSGESEDLGYNYYFTGKYTKADDVISIFQESYFQVGEAGKLFDSKEMLILVQTRSGSSDYMIKSNFKELHFICPPNALCMDESIFRRVD